MAKKSVHVTPKGNSWQVKTAGSARAAKVTTTQKEAIDKGIQIAKNYRSELVIHRKDGTIRAKDSYGNDPFPPRG
ncbi:MAG: DUF2188 domain-containing protein [Fimbriimonadaceae bacterium]